MPKISTRIRYSRPLRRVALAYSFVLLSALSLAAQRAQKSYVASMGFAISYLQTDFEPANEPLRRAGYPTLSSDGIRFEMSFEKRFAGRWQLGTHFSFDSYFGSGTSLANVNGVSRTSSTDYQGIGVRTGVGYDLLYPSAWNLLLGIDVEAFAGHLKNRRQTYNGPSGPFDGQTNENRYRTGAVSAIPELTLESIAFGSQETRVYLGVGYRISADTRITDEGANDIPGVGDISHGGLVLSVGLKSVIGRKPEGE